MPVFLDPSAVVLVMTAVLLIQIFLFGDGGRTTIGVNMLNTMIIGAFIWIYLKFKSFNEAFGMALASWSAVVLGAFLASVEIGISYSLPFRKVLSLMVGYHAVIGIGEALITFFVVNALKSRLLKIGGVPA